MSIKGFVEMEAERAPAAFRTPAFKRLRAEWMHKLEADGFRDSELRSASGFDSRLPNEHERGMPRLEYYRIAGFHLHDRVWPSRLRRRAFELHQDGIPYAQFNRRLSPMVGRQASATYYMVQEEVDRMVAYYVGGVR